MLRQRLFFFLTIFLVLSLLLVACERSLGGDEGAATPTIVTTGGETAVPDSSGGQTDAPAADTPAPSIVTETPIGETPSEATPGSEATIAPSEGEATPGSEPQPTVAPTTAPAEGEAQATTAPAETAVTPAPSGTITGPTTHTVVAGDTLYKIGLTYGVSWVQLAQLNNLANPNRLTVGQVLQIPGPSTPTPTPSPQTETTYVVKAGDNLFRIGLNYGISWVQIAEANGIVNPNQIYVGQTLKIPVSTPGPTPQFTHQVKAGETLFLISLQYGVPWTRIAEANSISSPYVIYVGQTLVIPGS